MKSFCEIFKFALLLLSFLLLNLFAIGCSKEENPELFYDFLNAPSEFEVRFETESPSLILRDHFSAKWRTTEQSPSGGETEIYLGKLEVKKEQKTHQMKVFTYSRTNSILRLVDGSGNGIYVKRKFLFE